MFSEKWQKEKKNLSFKKNSILIEIFFFLKKVINYEKYKKPKNKKNKNFKAKLCTNWNFFFK